MSLLMICISSAVLTSQITSKDWVIYESDKSEKSLGLSPISAEDVSISQIPWTRLSAFNKSFDNKPHQEQRVVLPLPDGTTETFVISPNEVVPQELSVKYPEIRSYTGHSVLDITRKVYLDITHLGMHALITGGGSTIYIDPYQGGNKEIYGSYYRKDAVRGIDHWTCNEEVYDRALTPGEPLETNKVNSTSLVTRKYELAVSVTGEYTQYFGGTVADALASIVTAINRVNSVYEPEVGVTMTLIPNTDELIFVDPNTDPYTNTTGDLDSIQFQVDSIIGSDNYDVGHLFSTTLGGVAGLGVVCQATNKARGITGHPNPNADPFYIDYLSHELGHQFDGSHTFNGDSDSCTEDQRSSSSAYEPGSGSTIQGYAGICDDDNLQNNSDAYFHPISLIQITNYIRASGDVCAEQIDEGNTMPTSAANAQNLDGKVIPISTPFVLTGDGSDADGDALTYQWDQWDLGPQQDVHQGDNGSSPIFRSFFPSTDKSRTFPRFSDLLEGTTVIGETLPTTDRDLTFTYVVRDNKGGWDDDQITISVVTAAGPFEITNLNSAAEISGNQDISWDVAGTDANGVNCDEVDISIVDLVSGNEILVLGNTPNDGIQTVVIPDLILAQVRIKVQCADNIFFDINNVDLSVAPANLPCNVFSEITDDPIVDGTYSSATELVASGKVPQGGSVIFTAESFFRLNPSFEVGGSGALEIFFLPCEE